MRNHSTMEEAPGPAAFDVMPSDLLCVTEILNLPRHVNLVMIGYLGWQRVGAAGV